MSLAVYPPIRGRGETGSVPPSGIRPTTNGGFLVAQRTKGIITVQMKTKERITTSNFQLLPFKTGDVIALRADNNMYLSRIHTDNTDPIQAAKSSIDDFCQFTVTVGPAGGNPNQFSQIALRADNNMYLSRIYTDNINPIQAAKSSIDDFCWFTAIACNPTNLIALLGDNLRYLSRIHTNNTDPIQAAKSAIDPFCQFGLVFLK